MASKFDRYDDYQIRRLLRGERIEIFDCGDADLNDFIVNESHHYRNALIAVTYVYEHRETGEIVAYFSLANDRVSLTDFDSKTEFNRFRRTRFVNEKRIRSYPAVKVCRLAVSNTVRGQGIGTVLLDFIKSYFLVDNKTGCRFVTVDAYPNAVPFYEQNDFQPLRNDDEPLDMPTQLLFYDLNDMVNQ